MKQHEDLEGTTAVCVGAPNNAKRAALFFENIWHLCPTPESAPRTLFPEGFNHDREFRDRFHELSYKLALDHPQIDELFDEAFTVVYPNAQNRLHAPLLLPNKTEMVYRMLEETYLQNVKSIRSQFLQLAGSLSSIHPIPVLSNVRSLENQNASVADINVTLSNLQIVDVANTSWEQIVEFRKDAESAKALRRLRVFLYEKCKDQSRAYIEDKMLTDLQAYDDAVKSHGFKLITGSLTTLMDSQSIIAATGAIVAGTLIGGPLVGLVSGVAIEVGKLSIEISKTLYSMRELKRDHSLAYIIEARDELTRNTN